MLTDGSERRCDVRFVKNLLIPLRDGTRLAADLPMPAGDGPFPVISPPVCWSGSRTRSLTLTGLL